MSNYIRSLSFLVIIFFCSTSFAGLKVIQKPVKDYDFKAVKKIVVLPITSKNVEFGKVDKDRLPKIKSILEKTKVNLRKNMVEGAKDAKTSIPFFYTAPDRKETTMLIEYDFELFDNGNFAGRTLSMGFGGKAKVKMRVKFINAKTKQVLTEMVSEAKASGGAIGGGLDSESLWLATNMANSYVYKKLKKLTGLEYSFVSGVTKGTKKGIKSQADIMKEEKQEKKVLNKKTK